MTSSHSVILGKRRITCLSAGLLRIEFSPDGRFDDRRSMVAHPVQVPQPFVSRRQEGTWDVFETGFMQVRTTRNDRACDRNNLEVRWTDGRLSQMWRPEDRDYQNLGGTLRSLDRFGGECAKLDGVSVAGMDSPDLVGTSWPAWLQDEIDPLYKDLHPAPPEVYGKRSWLEQAREPRNDGGFRDRTFNWQKESRRFCPGVLSESGYWFLNDSQGAVLDADGFPVERERPGYQDWYLFAYARDFRRALADFRLLCGAAPLPPHKSFGIIFSRWPAFREDEVRSITDGFNAAGHPMSTLVMDMEWHKEGWGHWELNPELIPDPKRFFAMCRERNLDVTFNDHPLDVRDDDIHFDAYVAAAGPDVEIRVREYNGKRLRMAKVDIANKQQNQAFFSICHPHLLEMGVNFWWNDGSRGQMAGTCGQLVTNKTCWEESERAGRRGMLLARYGGLGSHRYGAFFTGDTASDYHVLALQCEFNIRAAGVGLGYLSHDIGGFMIGHDQLRKNAAGVDIIDPNMYLRWLQFGVFNPILRFHSAPGSGSRVPGDYDALVGGACRKWLRERHALLPHLYAAARLFHDTGLPLVRGLFLDAPEDRAGYRYDEFLFGEGLLVAPILDASTRREVYLPVGTWWEYGTAKQLDGGRVIQRDVPQGEIAVFAKAGAIILRQSPDAPLHAPHISELQLDIHAGADGSAELYEDDGVSPAYREGDGCRTGFSVHDGGNRIELRGAAPRGRPLGATRTITIVLAWGRKPAGASLDGKPLTNAIAAEPGTGRWLIRLPALPSTAPFTLVITAV